MPEPQFLIRGDCSRCNKFPLLVICRNSFAEGYEFCQEEDVPNLIYISDILHSPDDYRDRTMVICNKEPQFMTISTEEIEILIKEKLTDQEDFYSDHNIGAEALEGTDEIIKALSEKINSNLSQHKFYFSCDIPLITPKTKTTQK